MKYEIQNITIPQEKRKSINEKILYVIDNNTNQLTAQDIFSYYTGDGGLHGLDYKNYNNRYEYGEAKKEIEQGQFFTPHAISKFIMDCLKPKSHDIIMDLTAGCGNFANYAITEDNIYLNEIDIKAVKVAKYLYPKANITNDDIRLYDPKIKADLIVGNPPFNLKWSIGKDEYLSQLYYTIKAAELLKPAGIMALITPSSFLADDFIDKGMITEVNKNFNFICQFDLSATAFKNVGVSSFETKVLIFQKKSEYITYIPYNTSKIDVNSLTDQQADIIYNSYIKPLQKQKESIKSKLFFENIHNSNIENVQQFQYQVLKMLYDIKRNPKINSKYAKANAYYEQFLTQKKPDNMDYKEWDKIKLTPNKVLNHIKKIIKNQNVIEKDIIKLVKTNNELKLKAYSKKMKSELKKTGAILQQNINDAVIHNNYVFDNQNFKKLINKKRKVYEQQTQDFNNMQEDNKINSFLNTLSFYDTVKEETIILNDIQRSDINKILQKQYGFLQYSMGGGKTLLGITNGLYRMQYNNINNPIVIGESIAIRGTWLEVLENYSIPYVLIEKLADLKKVQQGQFILITLYTVNKYKKHIKKYLKMNNKKFALIFDESDSITSLDTQAYKSVLSCFRKLVRYKLLLTGTSTRNNTNEVFGQLELLYNNSINMLCETDTIYETNKKTNDIESINNEYYLKPFPAYKKGYNLFRQTFSPAKATVFGLDKYNQDIYNSEYLSNLLNYTMITKTFKEITGREAFDGQVITCNMTNNEAEIYNKIISEFHELERLYYSSTGNSRKDAMLKALHQLNLLLRACSRFHKISGYQGYNISSKHIEVINYIKGIQGQRVAIGCIEKESCKEYERILKISFPERKIFVVDGERYNITQRKNLIKEFKKYDDCIVIATQSSLSCSLNIGFIDEIIIPELCYNSAKLEQFVYRFIRYNSINKKIVKFIIYSNSIEINLLKLIMVKEKINMFMKGEVWSDKQLENKYGINFELENMLLYKERDNEGNLKIVWNQWGEQKIV
jgi:predicted RNA methylase